MMKFQIQNIALPQYTGKVAIASNIGPHHIKNNMPNQDYVGYAIEGQKIAFAVADGLGSCCFSNIGSKLAVESVLELIKNDIENYSTADIENAICNNWKNSISENRNDYSTTLRFVIFTGTKIFVGGVGDGATLLEGENFHSFKSDDMFTNCTYALCDTIQNFSVKSFPVSKNEYRILIMTDGISNEIREDAECDLVDYMTVLLSSEVCEQEITEWIESLNNNNGDDKTLLMAVVKRN